MNIEQLYITNPYKGRGLGDNYKKKINNTVYYFLPKFLNKTGKDEWIACFRLSKKLIDSIDKQVYYDLVCLGLSSIESRPRCIYCGKEASFSFEVSRLHGEKEGYRTYCMECRYVHIGTINRKLFKGIPLSTETKKKLSEAKLGSHWSTKRRQAYIRLKRQGKLHFPLSDESRQKISLSKKGKVMSRNYYKSGKFTTKKYLSNIKDKNTVENQIQYLSSYEEAFLYYCEITKSIIGITVPDPVEYTKQDGSLHNYYPDFLIKFDTGDILIVEVKAYNLINTDIVLRKKFAIKKKIYKQNKELSNINCIGYAILTEKDLFRYSKKDPRKRRVNTGLNLFSFLPNKNKFSSSTTIREIKI